MVLGQARRQIRYLLLKLSLATHSIIDISEPSPEARSLLALSFWPLIGQEMVRGLDISIKVIEGLYVKWLQNY